MKILMILAVILSLSCASWVPLVQPEPMQSNWTEIVGHRYIVFTFTNGQHQIIHDPDCPCLPTARIPDVTEEIP